MGVLVGPVLIGMSPEAKKALGGKALILERLPFRVGRESRRVRVGGAVYVAERRKAKASSAQPNNDLYLVDPGRLLNVSREHFQIEKHGTGYRVVDRGSACGTLVGECQIGGHDTGGECPLADGDLIVVGTADSPFVFLFQERAPE